MTAPVAWLIEERQHGRKPRIMCGKVYLSEAMANDAAARLSNHWRTCVEVPVGRLDQ